MNSTSPDGGSNDSTSTGSGGVQEGTTETNFKKNIRLMDQTIEKQNKLIEELK
jgi:hypothetical protein